MPADALHYKFIAQELSDALTNGRIDKITSADIGAVRLSVYANGKTRHLFISISPARARCLLTEQPTQSLLTPTPFAAHLKKHLLGGRITQIAAEPNERVVKIFIAAKDELGYDAAFTLYAEIMGKHSNLILVNGSGKITDSIKRVPFDMSSKRQVLPGLPYTPAPVQNKANPLDENSLHAVLDAYSGGDLRSYLLQSLSGLSPASIFESVFNAFDMKNKNLTSDVLKVTGAKLTELALKRLAKEIKRLFDPAEFAPCVQVVDGQTVDFYLKPYHSCDAVGYEKAATLNEAAERYYREAEITDTMNKKQHKLTAVVKADLARAEKKLAALLEHKFSAEDFEHDRIKGEILTANLYRIKHGDKVLTAENYYVVPPIPIRIPLDDALSPAKLAGRFYKQYQKKKKTLEVTTPQIEAAKTDIEYLDSILTSLAAYESLSDLDEIAEELTIKGLLKEKKTEKRKVKTDTALSGVKKTEFDGYLILTGKNNLQNDALVKSCAPNDLWLHTKNIHGAHTVIVNPKKTLPPEGVIRHAAQITALYSKASDSEGVPVDYTFAKFVSKQKSAAPGKVIYKNQKTVYVTPKK